MNLLAHLKLSLFILKSNFKPLKILPTGECFKKSEAKVSPTGGDLEGAGAILTN